ncbi:MAG: peptidyl-prolyl cis-trans isomerase [Kiritimatiellae bacterium]|nr:peptidyl-prolyl cis-trans isomerase [Kiritimatiellia bacterium]
MFIYHFNRLIRNRFVWLVFALFVAFAFLSVDSCTGPGSRAANARDSAGLLNGHPVPASAYAQAEMFVRGGRTRGADLPPAMVETQAWHHLAAVHSAQAMGLKCTDDEIRQAIREVPSFSSQGQFDPRLYRQAIAQTLNVTPGVYERLMADQIALTKLAASISAANWISPMELEDEMSAWTDLLSVQYAVISNRFADTAIEIADADLRNYYDENAASFALPDRVGVYFAAMNASNYLNAVTVPDEDVEEYYDSNANLYTRAGTNDTLETKPLAEVRGEIVAELALDEACFAASTNAAVFVEALGMAKADEFAWRAKARGLSVQPSPLFGMEDDVPGVEPKALVEFREAAFDLDPARADARFAVVRGKAHVYIVLAWTNSPAHTPPFEQVRDQVRPLALAQARAKAFDRLTADLRAGIAADLAGGTNFVAAATARALQGSTTLTFAVQSAVRSDLPHGQALLPAAMRLRAGELSKPVPTSSGALLVYAVSRRPGDVLSSEMLRPELREAMSRRRGNALFGDWMRWNLDKLGFAPARPSAPSMPEEAEEEEP